MDIMSFSLIQMQLIITDLQYEKMVLLITLTRRDLKRLMRVICWQDIMSRLKGSLALMYVESCLFLSRVNQSQDCMVRALRHLMMVKKLMLQYLERLNTVTMI